MTGNTLGTLPQAPREYVQHWMNQVLGQLDRIHRMLSRPIGTGYSASNVTPTRTFDADSTSTAELADVLGTLIDDMKERGMLSK